MTKTSICITGLPYFPGVAVGRLHKGNSGDSAEHILLISQHELSSHKVLPAGFIVVEAMPFSHTMIGFLGLGIPTVLISAEQAAMLEENTRVLIDGGRGLITDDLTAEKPTEELSQNINCH